MWKDKHIFIINGAAGSGKDTFVDYAKILSSEFLEIGNVVNFSSVENIKLIAKGLGWSGKKNERDRKFLSDLKALTTEYSDFSFITLLHTVSRFLESPDESILFLHIREPEEIERAKIAFNAKTILVTKAGVEPITSNKSDSNVHCYEYDIKIRNDSNLESLKKTTARFISDIIDENIKSEYICELEPTLYASIMYS